jgi:hypothetical protein
LRDTYIPLRCAQYSKNCCNQGVQCSWPSRVGRGERRRKSEEEGKMRRRGKKRTGTREERGTRNKGSHRRSIAFFHLGFLVCPRALFATVATPKRWRWDL